MKKIGIILLLFPVIYAIVSHAEIESGDTNLTESINFLLSYVARSDCTFIRNGKEHTSQEAAIHMRRKYEHFKNEIKSPEDFIRLTATRSLMTGKPYMMKSKDGKILKSETWLMQALKGYQAERLQ